MGVTWAAKLQTEEAYPYRGENGADPGPITRMRKTSAMLWNFSRDATSQRPLRSAKSRQVA